MFDIRRIQVHSLKEFLKEFMMIVIGILTAITIEHQYTQGHKRHQAHQAAEQVRAEMQANLLQVRESIAANEQAAQSFRALEEKLLPLARAGADKGAPPASRQAALAEVMEGHFSIGFSAVEPAQDAWDAAVSSQLVSVMPRDELQRFSRVYARQRALANHIVAVQQGMRTGLWVRWNGMVTDLELGQAQPVELLKVVREHVGGLEALNRKLKAYEETLKEGSGDTSAGGRAAH